LALFARWFADERATVARSGVEELVERALERSGYDLAMLALPGGARRLANVRKLMRLGREHEAAAGADLRRVLRPRRRPGPRAGPKGGPAPVTFARVRRRSRARL